jgi:transcription elongation factor Elf1
MEIIKKGNTTYKEYEFTCRKCGCVAKFDEKDIKQDRDGEYIVCPSCGRFVSTESEYIRELNP